MSRFKNNKEYTLYVKQFGSNNIILHKNNGKFVNYINTNQIIPYCQEQNQKKLKIIRHNTNNIKTNNIKTNNIKTNNIKTNNIKIDNIKTNNIEIDNIKTNNIELDNNIETYNIKIETNNIKIDYIKIEIDNNEIY